MMHEITQIISAWTLVMAFGLLYQRRLYGVLGICQLQSLSVALAAIWQGFLQSAPPLYLAAVVILLFKVLIVPKLLRSMVVKLDIDRTVENALGMGPTLIIGCCLVLLALFLVLPISVDNNAIFSRLNLAIALSVLFLGILAMVARHNALLQVVGFLAAENGVYLAVVEVKGMPLVVEIGVAFTTLVSCLIIGLFVFRVRERFESTDQPYLVVHQPGNIP